MRRFLIAIFIIKIFVFCSDDLYGQEIDSLKVFFIGHYHKGEKFRVQYGGDVKLKFRSNGGYKYSFYVPIHENIEYGQSLNIHIFRKGRFCFFYKNTNFNSYYKNGYKYLIIIRDNTIKNRFAVRWFWSNEEPMYPHTVDYSQ